MKRLPRKLTTQPRTIFIRKHQAHRLRTDEGTETIAYLRVNTLEASSWLPGIKISEDAQKAKERVTLASGETLRAALKALSEYWCERQKRKGLRPESFFDKYRLDYKKETSKTLELYGKERKFRIQGDEVTMSEHFTLMKNTSDCLQIHCKLCKDEESILIGRVGRHLPNRRRPEQN